MHAASVRRRGHYETLRQFDGLYLAMGQFDYLWFHFHIARLADYLVAEPGALAAVLEDLDREFPLNARRRDTAAETLSRLERTEPGSAYLMAALTAGQPPR